LNPRPAVLQRRLLRV